MTPEEQARALEQEILVREVAELGALGGWLGGGGAESGGRSGGRWGARKLMRDDRRELSLHVALPAARALETAAEVLAEEGTPIEDSLPPLDPPEVWAVVAAGWRRLNPVVVRVAAAAVDDGRCTVTIRTAAKEGLIKQRAAQKAADLVRDRLVAAFGAAPS